MLSVIGAGLGLLLATWGTDLLGVRSSGNLPATLAGQINGRVLGFTLVVSVLTTFLFGLLPALRAGNTGPSDPLKDGARGMTAGAARLRLRGLLVVGEVALCLVLLIGAGLMMKSFLRLAAVDPGFESDGVLTMAITLPQERYPDGPPLVEFARGVLVQANRLPAVETVAVVSPLPFGPGGWQAGITIEGMPDPAPQDNPTVDAAAISPDYFRTMGIPLIQGRWFTEEDDARGPGVVLVSQTMARRFWPDQDALGQRLKFGPYSSERPWLTVVGIVGDVRRLGLETAPRAEFYVPYAQRPNAVRTMSLVARTTTAPLDQARALSGAVLAIDDEQPVYRIRTLSALVDASTTQRRTTLVLMGLFAVVAVILALVGIYGVMALLHQLRNNEIGVRVALGARPGDMLRLVLVQGMRFVLVGLSVGILAALALNRVLSRLLFSVRPTDPPPFVTLSALLSPSPCWPATSPPGGRRGSIRPGRYAVSSQPRG